MRSRLRAAVAAVEEFGHDLGVRLDEIEAAYVAIEAERAAGAPGPERGLAWREHLLAPLDFVLTCAQGYLAGLEPSEPFPRNRHYWKVVRLRRRVMGRPLVQRHDFPRDYFTD